MMPGHDRKPPNPPPGAPRPVQGPVQMRRDKKPPAPAPGAPRPVQAPNVHMYKRGDPRVPPPVQMRKREPKFSPPGINPFSINVVSRQKRYVLQRAEMGDSVQGHTFFRGLKIQVINMNYRNAGEDSGYDFYFVTKILYADGVRESAFKEAISFQQKVSTIISADSKYGSLVKFTGWHNDNYSVADFNQSGAEEIGKHYIGTSDNPGHYNVMWADNRPIYYEFKFKQSVYRRDINSVLHETPELIIKLEGAGSSAALSPSGLLYDSSQ